MKRHTILFFCFLLIGTTGFAAESKPVRAPTQADLIIGLVDSLGWSFGLPDDPEIDDYLTILQGRRVWRFEFEDIYQPSPDAPVYPKETRSFGPFSGKRWQRAPSHQVEPKIAFLLPISGEYEVRATLTKPGYRFTAGDTQLAADGTDKFSEVSFGSVDLQAGQQSARVTIPSRGGIDYILLTAPPTTTIDPGSTWEPMKKLSYGELAISLSRLFELEPLLPPAPDDSIRIEAEEAPVPQYATVSNDRYQGSVSGDWFKTNMHPASYSHLFAVEKKGVYDLSLNVRATLPVTGLLNGREYFEGTPTPYFSTLSVGAVHLDAGINQLEIDLPPRAGLDRITFTPRASAEVDYLRLTGLPAAAEPTPEQLDRILKLIAAIGARR